MEKESCKCQFIKKGRGSSRKILDQYLYFPLIVSKTLERCVYNSIKDHVFSQIHSGQHGFLPGKNRAAQLIEVFDKIGKLLDRGKQIDVIYLDLSKAFDKVSHNVYFVSYKIVVSKQQFSVQHHHLSCDVRSTSRLYPWTNAISVKCKRFTFFRKEFFYCYVC